VGRRLTGKTRRRPVRSTLTVSLSSGASVHEGSKSRFVHRRVGGPVKGSAYRAVTSVRRSTRYMHPGRQNYFVAPMLREPFIVGRDAKAPREIVPAVALSSAARRDNYTRQNGGRPPTAQQRRRGLKKHRHQHPTPEGKARVTKA
jgi:hypothetical protein